MIELVLASQSPRRQELLSTLGYPFTQCPAVGEEVLDPSLSPDALVESLAKQKAKEVLTKHPNCLILGSDTLVVLGDKVFGKPKDEADAIAMITALQGNTHHVYTGACLMTAEKTVLFHEVTALTMRSLTQKQVVDYVAQGESMDKAGGYGIQGLGAWLTESITGDYFNVMGLPLCALGKHLATFGIELFGSEGVC